MIAAVNDELERDSYLSAQQCPSLSTIFSHQDPSPHAWSLNVCSPGQDADIPANNIAVTPKEYAEHVSQFSKVHTGAGQRLVGLADFLNSAPYTVIVDGDDGSKDDAPREQPFMTLYDIDSKQCDASGRLTPVEVSTPDDLATRPLPARNQLVFMKGYPSPLWLNVIGAKFKVDPDFFARHLDFLIPSTSAKFPRPALPSSLSHQVQLLVTTVGSRDCAGKLKQAVLDKLRTEEEDSFDTYKKALSTGSDFQTGCALVRRYGTLDGDQFFIEQKISLVVLMRGDHWTSELLQPPSFRKY